MYVNRSRSFQRAMYLHHGQYQTACANCSGVTTKKHAREHNGLCKVCREAAEYTAHVNGLAMAAKAGA